MREHLRQRCLAASDAEADDGDWSGLRRAAAYFEAQSNSATAEVDESQAKVDASHDDPDSWLGLLTEEQVSALIRELLSEKATPTPSPRAENANEEGGADAPEQQETDSLRMTSEPDAVAPLAVDQETDMSGFLAGYVQMVAEKEVQTGGDAEMISRPRSPDPPTSSTSIPVPSDASMPASSSLDSTMMARTNLARAMVSSSTSPPPSDCQASKHSAVVSRISILQKLREERKRFQRTHAARLSHIVEHGSMEQRNSIVTDAQASPLQSDRREVTSDDQQEDLDDASDGSHDSKDMDNGGKEIAMKTTSDDGGSEEAASSQVAELVPMRLFAGDVSSSQSSSVASSFSPQSSFSDLESVSYGAMYHKYTPGTSRSQRHIRRVSASSEASSFRDSIVSEDLSEGEMEAQEDSADLSDGELFGKERARVVKEKNANTRFFSGRGAGGSDSGSDGIKSSAESGELLPIVRTRACPLPLPQYPVEHSHANECSGGG